MGDVIGRWNGAAWSWNTPVGGFVAYEAVGGVGDAVIVLGTEGRVGVVMGSTFNALPVLPAGHATDILRGVWGTSADDFYVVGLLDTGGKGVIHHYVNDQWTTPPVEVSKPLRGVWGVGPTVYAVGDAGLIVTLREGSWTEEITGSLPALRAISGSGRDAIAVAESGAIWRISPP